MPLMGSLYIGVSGLQTSQNSLNTTAHNVSNAENVGYVRQQILQGTSTYNTIQYNRHAVSDQQIGLGVVYAKTRQVRDVFLDNTYRREIGRQGFYGVSVDALEEIECLLDEMNGESFQESIQDLWGSVQELAKDPSSAVTQGLFVERCSEFLSRGQSVYEGLVDYQKSLDTQVKSIVDKINDHAERIKFLNDQIRNIECGGFEEANDLRDERNQLLDELGSFASITYSEDLDSTVWVQLEGEDLVRGEVAYKIIAKQDPDKGLYDVFWEKNARYELNSLGERTYSKEEIAKARVFDMDRLISSDLNTDIGKLKSTLLARGDHKGIYTDLDASRYSNSVSQSLCMNIMAEFDQLVHNVATKVNEILVDAANRATTINPSSTYLRDEQGNPIQVFQKKAGDGYYFDTVTNSYQYMAEDPNINETLYTTTNMQINMKLLQQPTKLGFVLPDGSVDFTTMEEMKKAFTVEDTSLNINVKKKSNFVDYYSDLISQVANSGSVYKSILDSQEATVTETDNARQQIIGVSTDEEMTFMIKFQNAYNASSRYINVVDEMLEHIINTLGS
ncbi:MAG: flagellar hook-associated protein FlgK [Lachnospiraceae bacterium]|nr:flagellar hook-associated protein FlgK [Lachnospiraceae bacterium]